MPSTTSGAPSGGPRRGSSLTVGTLPAPAQDSNNNKNNASNSQGLDLKPYGRFDEQLRLIQGDISTFLEEPENSKSYNEWKKQFVLEEKGEEIENLIAENGVIREIYGEVVPSRADEGNFWSRYFYSVHKLKRADDARGAEDEQFDEEKELIIKEIERLSRMPILES